MLHKCLSKSTSAVCIGYSILGSMIAPLTANAQVISGDDSPAPTLTIRPQDYRIQESLGRSVFIEVFSTAQWTSNALSVSNLPGGLELKARDDVFWQKGVGLTAVKSISSSAAVFGRIEASHVNFFRTRGMDYFNPFATLGLRASLGRSAFAYAAVSCSAEVDNSFREYYHECGPRAGIGVMTGNPYSGTGLEAGVQGALSFGRRLQYARHADIGAYLNFETGSERFRFRIRPRANMRLYSTPALLSLGGPDRRDYRAGLEAALLYRWKGLELGLVADPRVNWSNYVQYRYWDFRVGPSIKIRFGL